MIPGEWFRCYLCHPGATNPPRVRGMTWSRHYREAHAADDHPRRQELREANRPHPVDRSTGKGSGRDAFLVARQEIRDARA